MNENMEMEVMETNNELDLVEIDEIYADEIESGSLGDLAKKAGLFALGTGVAVALGKTAYDKLKAKKDGKKKKQPVFWKRYKIVKVETETDELENIPDLEPEVIEEKTEK